MAANRRRSMMDYNGRIPRSNRRRRLGNGCYIRVLPNEAMAQFTAEDCRLRGISDRELAGSVVGSAAGFAAPPETVRPIRVDNLNDVFGSARVRLAESARES